MNVSEMRALLQRVRFHDWHFHLGEVPVPYLQVHFDAGGEQHGRKWYLSPHMTESELVQTAFLAVLQANEHEVREGFRYDGRAVYGPHFDVEALVALCDTGAVDVRPPLRAAGGAA